MLNRFAVMGNPISHSLSPVIHQQFAQQTGIQLSYERLLVSKEEFQSQVSHFFMQGGKGLNITLPFKEKAYAMAARCTSRAMQAKAVNTLWMDEDQLYADNTDGVGLIHDLAHYVKLAQQRVLILGAGGAARGIIGPLLATEIKQLVVVNRTLEKAHHLKADFAAIKLSSFSTLHGQFDLIINATSASLSAEKMNLSHTLLKPTTLCYDLAYSTKAPTVFVEWAQTQGVRGIDGLGMLVEQAAESFFVWHKIRPDARKVLQELKSKT